MKIKTKILAAALALGLTGAASAANVTYVGGATSFRNVANVVIANYATNHGGQLLASDSGTLTSATNLLVSYTNASGTNYIVAHWTGAGIGIQSAAGPAEGLSNAATIGFWNTNVTGWTNAPASGSTATNQHTLAVTFSENFQSTTLFNGTVKGVTYANLSGFDGSDGIVAVSPYSWAGSKGIPTNANITASTAQNLLLNNNEPLSLITGNPNDETNSVFLIGRNIDAGARYNVFAEAGFGVRGVAQSYAVGTNFTGGGASTATIQGGSSTNEIFLYPIETIDGISSGSVGNSGYNSGGTVVGLLTSSYARGSQLLIGNYNSSNTTISSTSAWTRTGSNFLVGFAALGDVISKTNAGLVPLTFNGVAYSTNAVIEGQYTLWGYEHIYLSPNAASVDIALASAWGNSILATPTAQLYPVLNYNDVNAVVGRNGDGLPIYPNY